MPSFGEGDIIINSTTAGRFSVKNMFVGSAIFPRLHITIGCTLNDTPDRSKPPAFPGLQLADLRGELQLSEGGHAIGRVEWAREQYRVTGNAYEHQLEMSCDLDQARMEAIERWRNGKEPVFYLQLWPTLVGTDGLYNQAQSRTIRASVPRDLWLDVLSRLQNNRWMLVEIEVSAGKGEIARAAAEQVDEAWKKIDQGEFDSAVMCCRKAMDAIDRLMPKGDGDQKAEPMRKLLEEGISEKRGEHYAGMLSKLRRLAAHAAHEFDNLPFSRAEARLIASTTANFIALIGSAEESPRKQ